MSTQRCRSSGDAARVLALLREDAVIEGNTLDRLTGFAAEWARGDRASDAARLVLRTAVAHRHPPRCCARR